MSEQIPSQSEKFPTEAEVLRIMERLFSGAEFTEVRRAESDGVLERLVYEGIDSEGDIVLYDYFQGAVDVVFHDKEGIPCGGYNVANYENGGWKIEDN